MLHKNLLTALHLLLWLLVPMASCSVIFALHLTITLESTDLKGVVPYNGLISNEFNFQNIRKTLFEN